MTTILHLNSSGLLTWNCPIGEDIMNVTVVVGESRLEEITQSVKNLLKVGRYDIIASTSETDMEKIFHDSNSHEDYWGDIVSQQEGWVVFGNKHHRSTSVGDMMIQDGKVYIVASFGFLELPKLAVIADILSIH